MSSPTTNTTQQFKCRARWGARRGGQAAGSAIGGCTYTWHGLVACQSCAQWACRVCAASASASGERVWQTSASEKLNSRRSRSALRSAVSRKSLGRRAQHTKPRRELSPQLPAAWRSALVRHPGMPECESETGGDTVTGTSRGRGGHQQVQEHGQRQVEQHQHKQGAAPALRTHCCGQALRPSWPFTPRAHMMPVGSSPHAMR